MPEPIQTTEEVTEEVKPETETKPAETPATPPIDYEKKFKDSQRENELLREAEKQREAAAQELTTEPTDSDLRAAFPEWDTLSDFEKKMARENLSTKRIAAAAAKKADDLTSAGSWSTSIELAVSSNPALQGREQAFRQFASQLKYRGTDMDLLVSAFLQKNPTAPTSVTPRPGLEPASGGPRETPKPKALSAEELGALRTSDPRAYEKYIKTHDIEIDI